LQADVIGFERDESHVVPLLPILKHLVVELAPSYIQRAGLDELAMESGADA